MTYVSRFLQAVGSIVRKEKKYSVLLALTVVLYIVLLFVGNVETEYTSPALEKIKKLETLQQEEDLNAYLEEQVSANPTLQAYMTLFNLYILVLFILGVALNINVGMRMRERRELIVGASPPAIPWKSEDVAKALVLLLFASVVIPLFFEVSLFCTRINLADNLYTLTQACLFDACVVAVMWYFVVHVRRVAFRDLGLRSYEFGRDVMRGLITYSWILPLFFLMLLILTAVTKLFHLEPPPHALIDILVVEDKHNPFIVLWSIVLASAIGPIVEELFFRGFLYGAVRKMWGARSAIIVSSLLFAYVHHSAFSFVPIFFLGAVLAYLREKRGSLIPSIVMHSVHNTTLLAYFFLIKRTLMDTL